MIRKYFIWWHRRREGYHRSCCIIGSTFHDIYHHKAWQSWHREQAERILNEQTPAPK